jgi:hypothetical protein
MRGISLLALYALLFAGCEPAPTEIDVSGRSVSLHGLLVAGADQAAVVITEMRTSSQYPQLVAVPVTGATARLVAGADTVELVSGSSAVPCTSSHWNPDADMSAACYAGVVTGGIQAGRRYDLHVVLQDGRTIRGSTIVPHPASLLQPGPGAEIRALRHNSPGQAPASPISWQDGQTQRMELIVAPELRECAVLQTGTQGALPQIMDVTGMTATFLRLRVSCQPQHGELTRLPAEIVLMSYDANYAAHARNAQASGPPPHGAESNGITGAFGVFGSVARVRVSVTLVIE